MKPSAVSGQSLSYKLEQYSASAKMLQTDQESGKTTQLGVKFSQFSASVTFESFESINKQGILVEETFLSKLQELKSASSQALASHPLLGEDGEWGVKKTSGRISNFVLQGAGNDLEKLKAGREGVLRGFKQAEEAWGSKLPEISYETMAKSLEAIDEKIRELGGSVVDIST